MPEINFNDFQGDVKELSLDALFPAEGETTPRLRFKGFEGEWQRVCFGDLYEHCIVKNDLTYGKDKIISVANMYYIQDANVSDDDYLRTYNVFKLGDIAFEGNKSKNFAHGRFVENTIGDGIVSHVFEVFRPKSDNFDLMFWKYAINNEMLMGKILSRCTKASTMMTNLVAQDFLKESILVPSLEEQQKIGGFLQRLDAQIALHKQQYERLQQLKSACLNSMFPQNGGGILPAIRFKGFNGVWITKSFTDIFTFLKNNSLSRAELDLTGTVMNVHYGDVLVKFGDLIDMSKEALPYIKNDSIAASLAESCRLQNGDIVFADAAEDNTVGKCAEIMSIDNRDAVSGLHTIPCRPVTGMFAEGFLGYCLNAPSFHDQLLPLIQGTKISSISKKALSSTFITYPSDIDEQLHIASFFRSLDTKILLQTQRIEKLKQMKAACLNKMIA